MKKLVLLLTVVLAMNLSAQQRKAFEGFESNLNYTNLPDAQSHSLQYAEIHGFPFAFKTNGQILFVPTIRQKTNLANGIVKEYYSKTPLNLFVVPGLKEYELKTTKATINSIEEIREMIFEVNETTVDLPIRRLTVGNDTLIAIKCSKEEMLYMFRELKFISSSVYNKGCKILNAKNDRVEERLYNNLTEEEASILKWCSLCMIVTTSNDNPDADMEFGCKNVYVLADRMYILAPESLKRRRHRTWERNDDDGKYFNLPKVEQKEQEPLPQKEMVQPQMKENPKKTHPKPETAPVYKKSAKEKPIDKEATGEDFWHKGKQYYIVAQGDFLTLIAKTYEINVNELKRLNPNIKNFNHLVPGQKLRLK